MQVCAHTSKEASFWKRKLFTGSITIRHKRTRVMSRDRYQRFDGCEIMTQIERGSDAQNDDTMPSLLPYISFSLFRACSLASRFIPSFFPEGGRCERSTFPSVLKTRLGVAKVLASSSVSAIWRCLGLLLMASIAVETIWDVDRLCCGIYTHDECVVE